MRFLFCNALLPHNIHRNTPIRMEKNNNMQIRFSTGGSIMQLQVSPYELRDLSRPAFLLQCQNTVIMGTGWKMKVTNYVPL